MRSFKFRHKVEISVLLIFRATNDSVCRESVNNSVTSQYKEAYNFIKEMKAYLTMPLLFTIDCFSQPSFLAVFNSTT